MSPGRVQVWHRGRLESCKLEDKLEIAGVAEKLFSCHSSLTRKPAWWEMKGQEGERKVRGRKVNPELLLHVNSCLFNSSLTLLSSLYLHPQHLSQEPQALVTLEQPPNPAKGPPVRKLVLEEPSGHHLERARITQSLQIVQITQSLGSMADLGPSTSPKFTFTHSCAFVSAILSAKSTFCTFCLIFCLTALGIQHQTKQIKTPPA